MTDNTYPDLDAVDAVYRQSKAIMDAAAKAKAMDALIAGDADLYDVPPLGGLVTAAKVVVGIWGVDRKRDAGRMDKAIHRLSSAIASARIKGDKDRSIQSSAPTEPEYDHTQDGTANFERALLYASYHEVEIERLTKALERANSQTEQFERDYYLKCDEHERDLKDAASFMGKRDADMLVLTELAHQYLSDLRYPPAQDSKERRIERIEAMLKKVQP